MRRFLIPLVSLATLAILTASAWYIWFREQPLPPPPPWTDDMQAVADGNNRFALDLYGKLREEEPGNIFFSSYSAQTALAMTATGARGQTRDEMVKILHLPAEEGKRLASGDLGQFYSHPRRDFELSVANSLWGQKGFPWRPEFLDIQKTHFGAGFNEADFTKDPDGERMRINRWVEEKTLDRIKDLLPENIVTSKTRMVLANAIYFKGRWEKQFEPKSTRDAPFTLADGTKVSVPMMHREGGFRHYVLRGDANNFQPELQVAELPYKGGELSMVVLVPGKHDGLPALEAKLSAELLDSWLSQAHETKDTGLALPKFRIETKAMRLKEPLQKLGMIAAFDPDMADFSGMAPEALFVSAVVQKAFVDVNEEGTEAAAATAVVMNRPTSAPLSFRADRPFLFLIRDARHGTILFMGRVTNPKP